MTSNDAKADPAETEKPSVLSAAELKAQDERYDRLAKRVIDTFVKAMPGVIPSLKLQGSDPKVAHKVDISGLASFDALLSVSYVVVKGDKQRTIFVAVLNADFYRRLKHVLENSEALRVRLTEKTLNIQFACPDLHAGVLFKRVSKGFLRGSAIELEGFST